MQPDTTKPARRTLLPIPFDSVRHRAQWEGPDHRARRARASGHGPTVQGDPSQRQLRPRPAGSSLSNPPVIVLFARRSGMVVSGRLRRSRHRLTTRASGHDRRGVGERFHETPVAPARSPAAVIRPSVATSHVCAPRVCVSRGPDSGLSPNAHVLVQLRHPVLA